MPSSQYLLPNIFNKGNGNGNGIESGFASSLPMPMPRQPSSENVMIGSPLNTTTYQPGMIRPL